MFRFKRKILWLIIALGTVIIGLALWWLMSSGNNIYKTYSLNDFPTVKDKEGYQQIVDGLNQDVKQLQQKTLTDGLAYDLWNDMGVRKLALQDYGGAEQAWQKAMSINPKNPLAIANLANLYKSFLKDYPQAEKYYLQAIGLNVTAEPYFPDYEGLADLYINFWSEQKAKVEPLMLAALDKAYEQTNRVRFYRYLANFFRETDEAKYQQYRADAIKLNPSLKDEL